MSEQRQKTHSILLRAGGKALASLELFPSGQWPEQSGGDALFRVRVNDAWHSPTGRHSFLSLDAVGELVAELLCGDTMPQEDPVPYLPHKAEVQIYLEDMPMVSRGWVHAPPHQERDGRWYVWVWVPGGPRKLPAGDVTLRRVG